MHDNLNNGKHQLIVKICTFVDLTGTIPVKTKLVEIRDPPHSEVRLPLYLVMSNTWKGIE